MTDTINSRDFVDIAAFYVAMGAVGDILLMRGKGEALPPDLQGMDLDSLDAQFQGAVPLLRRVGAVFDQGMEVLLGNALEMAKLRVKTRLTSALRGNPVSQFRARADFLTDMLPRLGAHQGAVRDSIADVHGRMLLLCRAAGNSNPVARLFEVASLAPCSGHYVALKKWQTAASSLCGNACPEHEVLAADITEAAALVESIRDIDRRLETKDPTDPTSVDLTEAKAQAQGDLSRVIAESSDPRAVQTVVAQTVSQEKKHITRVANAIKGGLTPDQEECVISRGRVVIAAGAGSGKTRVLASKVVYHIQEAGLHPGNVMAVSFSRKSAGELKSRVFDYAEAAGAPMDRRSYYPGMGTTHSIARMILNQSGRFRVSASPSAPERERVVGGSDIKNLIHVAIAQVQMKGGTGAIPADAMSFFPNLTGSPTVASPGTPSTEAISAVKSPVQNPPVQASPLNYYLEDPARYEYLITTAQRALTEALGSIMIKSVDRNTAKGPARVFTVGGPGLSDFYGVLSNMVTPAGRMKFEKANPQYRSPDQFVIWAQQTVSADAFKAAVHDGLGFGRIQAARQELTVLAAMNPKDLTPTQQATLQGIVTRPLVASRLKATGAPVARMATEVTEEGIAKAADKQVDNLRNNRNSPYYYWFHNPANQWFNQGISPKAFETEDKAGNPKPVPLSEFTRYIGLVKNSMIAPGRAWTDAGDDKAAPDTGEDVTDDQDTLSERVLAAVYGAYEWLKGNVEHLKGRLDYDDQLIQASRVLTENPQVLRKLQMQYKCILVDEAQDLNKCVSGDTEVITPQGPVTVQDLQVGTQVLSYDTGTPTYHRVTAKAQSHWTRGYRIHLRSGRTLTMSPDHQIYATPLERVPQGQMALYLMYREGMGFRLGTSSRPFHSSEGGSAGRAQAEKADAMWILEVGETEEILYKEQAYSLKYGVPTYIYEGFNHGCDQPRIDRLFQEFGENGRVLLGQYDLQFGLPHWTNQTNTRGRFNRRVVALNAHRANQGSARGSYVGLTWTGDVPEGCAVPVYRVKNDRNMINKYSRSYTEARETAQVVAAMFGGRVVENLSIQGETLPLMTASGLFEGMKVPVLDRESNSTVLDTIESIELVDGGSYFDITVEEASNFFGNEVLSHNCQHVLFGLLAGYLDPGTIKPRVDGKMTADTFAFIGDDKQAIYEFRGALPGEFIRKSELVPDNEGFKTYLLDTNYRSGSEIVEAANRLIAHNTDQIPMVCKATPAKGMGKIVREQVGFADEGPRVLTERILQAKEEAEAQGVSMKGFYKNFGLAVRTNGEVAMYAMAMIEAGIPFRSKKNFFGGPILGPLTSLLKLYIPGTPVDERNECVVKGVRAPNFGVNGKTLADKLEALRAGDYLEYLTTDKGYTRIYSMDSMTEKMKAYVSYLEELEGLASKGNSRAMIDFILNYKTPDGSNFGEQLAAEVRNDEEEMEEVRMAAAEAKSEVTPELLLAQALKPMSPIYAVAEKYPKAKDFIGYLNSLVIKNQTRNKTDAEDIDGESDTVTIDTVHGWKGLEVAHLFLPMEEDKFPHMMSSGTEEGLASERRLAYVGFTRGQQSVTIIEPKYRQKGEKVIELNPSKFVEEACIPLAGKAGGKGAEALRGDEDDDVEGDRPMDREASCSDFDFPELNLEPDPEGTLLDLWGPTMDPKEIA